MPLRTCLASDFFWYTNIYSKSTLCDYIQNTHRGQLVTDIIADLSVDRRSATDGIRRTWILDRVQIEIISYGVKKVFYRFYLNFLFQFESWFLEVITIKLSILCECHLYLKVNKWYYFGWQAKNQTRNKHFNTALQFFSLPILILMQMNFRSATTIDLCVHVSASIDLSFIFCLIRLSCVNSVANAYVFNYNFIIINMALFWLQKINPINVESGLYIPEGQLCLNKRLLWQHVKKFEVRPSWTFRNLHISK